MKENLKTIFLGVALFGLCIFAALYQNRNGAIDQTQYETNVVEKEPGGLTRYKASFFDVFDTVTDIVAYSSDEDTFNEQISAIKEKLKYYHKLFDIYNDYEGINNIKTINDNAGIAPVTVERDIIELLLLSKKMYTQTNGQMNVAMGSVLKICSHALSPSPITKSAITANIVPWMYVAPFS